MEAQETLQQPEESRPRSFFSRLGGVYLSPGETFRDIGRSPDVLLPMIALVILGLLVGYYMAQKIDLGSMMAEPLQQAVADGRLTEEQMEQQLAVMSKFGGVQMTVGNALGTLLMTLVIAALFKLISVMIGAENRFKAVFAATLYTFLAVSIVQYAVTVLILYFKSPGELTVTSITSLVASNLGALLAGLLGEDALPKFLMSFFGWIDLFAIWMIALLAIGYAAVSRKLKTSTAAIWLGGVYVVIALIASAAGSLFGARAGN